MKYLPLLLLAACSAPAPTPNYATPPPINTFQQPETPKPRQEDPVVAFVNDKPIYWKAVADFAFSTQGKDMIDQYIAWKLREDKVKALGVVHTPEELQARAQVYLDIFRKAEGEAALLKQLDTLKVTEKEYVERFATHGPFREKLTDEKLFMYAILTEPTIEIDTVAFSHEDDAKAFVALVATKPFDKACEDLLKVTTKGRVAQWPRYRFAKGLAPDTIATANWIEKRLFEMKRGETTGVETTSSELKLVINVLNVFPAAAGTYAELREQVMKEILKRPPTEAQQRLWIQRLFRESKIQYEDRYTSGNKVR